MGSMPDCHQQNQGNLQDQQKPIPVEYHEFLEVFTEKEPTAPPPHRVHDHHIRLEEAKMPPYEPLQPLNE